MTHYHAHMPFASERWGSNRLGGDYTKISEGLGAYAERVAAPDQVGHAIRRGLDANANGQTAVIEVITQGGRGRTQLLVGYPARSLRTASRRRSLKACGASACVIEPSIDTVARSVFRKARHGGHTPAWRSTISAGPALSSPSRYSDDSRITLACSSSPHPNSLRIAESISKSPPRQSSRRLC